MTPSSSFHVAYPRAKDLAQRRAMRSGQSPTPSPAAIPIPVSPTEAAQNGSHDEKEEEMQTATQPVPVTQPRWTNLGSDISGHRGVPDVLKTSGLDFQVELRKLMYGGSNGPLVVDGWSASVRTDTDGMLGIVGPRYTVVQNAEAFQMLDSALASGVLRGFRAGYWERGAYPWVVCALPDDIEIAEVPITPLIMMATSHNGRLPVTVSMNGYDKATDSTLALHLRGQRVAVRHLLSGPRKITDAASLINVATAYFGYYKQVLEGLALKQLSTRQFKDAVEILLPHTDSMTDAQKANVNFRRDQLITAFHNQGITNGYGALIIFSQWFDHYKDAKRQPHRAMFERQMWNAFLGDGVGAKQEALNVLHNV